MLFPLAMLVQKMMQTEAVYTMFCSSCTQSCVFSCGLERPMSRVGSIVVHTSAVSTMAGCDADDDKWSFLLIRLKKKTWNRIWKQLLSPSSINGTITTRSYCHIFSFELTWKCYILNHVCQMKGNSMKTQRYTGTFWTFYFNPKLSVCSKSAYQ